jgi:hypothetical protein
MPHIIITQEEWLFKIEIYQYLGCASAVTQNGSPIDTLLETDTIPSKTILGLGALIGHLLETKQDPMNRTAPGKQVGGEKVYITSFNFCESLFFLPEL